MWESGAYLGFEGVFLSEGGFEVRFEFEVAGVQHFVVALELFGFPAGAAVLEPHGHLAGLQAELLGKLHFALGLQLVLHLEVALQGAHLVEREPALFLHRVREVGVGVAIVVRLLHRSAVECGVVGAFLPAPHNRILQPTT